MYQADGQAIGAVEWGHKRENKQIKVISDVWPYASWEMRIHRRKPKSIKTFFDPSNPAYLAF